MRYEIGTKLTGLIQVSSVLPLSKQVYEGGESGIAFS
jgi:hypothetical protein